MNKVNISKDKLQQMIDDVAEDLTWLRAIDAIRTRSKYNLTNFNEWFNDPFYPVSSSTYVNETGELLGAVVILVTDDICLAKYDPVKDAMVISDRNHADNYSFPELKKQFEIYINPFGKSAVDIDAYQLQA